MLGTNSSVSARVLVQLVAAHCDVPVADVSATRVSNLDVEVKIAVPSEAAAERIAGHLDMLRGDRNALEAALGPDVLALTEAPRIQVVPAPPSVPPPPARDNCGAFCYVYDSVKVWSASDYALVGGGGAAMLLCCCACYCVCKCRHKSKRENKRAHKHKGGGKHGHNGHDDDDDDERGTTTRDCHHNGKGKDKGKDKSKGKGEKKKRKSSLLEMAVLERKHKSYGNFCDEGDEPSDDQHGRGGGSGPDTPGGGAGIESSESGPGRWEELYDDESGMPYWYNHQTYETSWDKPAGVIALEAPNAPPPPPSLPLTTLPMIGQQGAVSIPPLPVAMPALPPPPPPPAAPAALPVGWEAHEDDDSGAVYFFNSATGETTWERPC